jgi:hypothetical protein
LSQSGRQQDSRADLADAIGRREAIRRATLVLGGALSASAIAGVLAGCDAGASHAASWKPRALSSEQAELLATIAEHIVPQTDTPGARAAGVDRFIDTMLADYHQPAERDRFLAGLADVDARAKRAHSRTFSRCDATQQRGILETLDREAFPPRAGAATVTNDEGKETERGGAGTPVLPSVKGDSDRRGPEAARRPFMRTMKELTVLGYYTSEIGATKELRYVQVPGRFEGCVPLTANDRTWAV